MSAASCLLSEDQSLCSICLNVFTDPVSTPCGHNFCNICISQHWDISERCQCPVCKKAFEVRPELHINTFISEMVSQFRHETQQKVSSSSSEQQAAKPGERSSEVEQLSRSKDHLHLLQGFSSLKGTVVRAVGRLKETLSKDMKKLFEAELKRVQQYAVDMTLDPDTAHPYLILSDDGKQVHCGGEENDLPDNPERFSVERLVLGKQSFSSGRLYFEVQVKEKPDWVLGVVRESVNRKEVITLSPANGLWTVGAYENICGALEDPTVPLSLQRGSEKVGVFVDYEEGLVSFYDVDDVDVIYSFTGWSFTEKLYPLFCPNVNVDNDDENSCGKKIKPLIICPVNQSV
uniref:Zinc finger protein RFP-like n=1 Tax=Maylandia zebra TaxID=106582 RepID=A0A3P9C0P3_9CICH